jgi:hypothetical protein
MDARRAGFQISHELLSREGPLPRFSFGCVGREVYRNKIVFTVDLESMTRIIKKGNIADRKFLQELDASLSHGQEVRVRNERDVLRGKADKRKFGSQIFGIVDRVPQWAPGIRIIANN